MFWQHDGPAGIVLIRGLRDGTGVPFSELCSDVWADNGFSFLLSLNGDIIAGHCQSGKSCLPRFASCAGKVTKHRVEALPAPPCFAPFDRDADLGCSFPPECSESDMVQDGEVLEATIPAEARLVCNETDNRGPRRQRPCPPLRLCVAVLSAPTRRNPPPYSPTSRGFPPPTASPRIAGPIPPTSRALTWHPAFPLTALRTRPPPGPVSACLSPRWRRRALEPWTPGQKRAPAPRCGFVDGLVAGRGLGFGLAGSAGWRRCCVLGWLPAGGRCVMAVAGVVGFAGQRFGPAAGAAALVGHLSGDPRTDLDRRPVGCAAGLLHVRGLEGVLRRLAPLGAAGLQRHQSRCCAVRHHAGALFDGQRTDRGGRPDQGAAIAVAVGVECGAGSDDLCAADSVGGGVARSVACVRRRCPASTGHPPQHGDTLAQGGWGPVAVCAVLIFVLAGQSRVMACGHSGSRYRYPCGPDRDCSELQNAHRYPRAPLPSPRHTFAPRRPISLR